MSPCVGLKARARCLSWNGNVPESTINILVNMEPDDAECTITNPHMHQTFKSASLWLHPLCVYSTCMTTIGCCMVTMDIKSPQAR